MKYYIVVVITCVLMAAAIVFAMEALASSIDNDALLGFKWAAPSNEWAVDHYDIEWWASGFAPQGGTLTTDTTFVVIDMMFWLPGVNQMDSVKVCGKNAWGEGDAWSDAAEPVQIHIIPEVPGRPYWTSDNQ